MKAQGEGLIINISSWAGKHVSVVTGPAYTAAKHAMNAMNESINMEAGVHGACVLVRFVPARWRHRSWIIGRYRSQLKIGRRWCSLKTAAS